MHGPTVSMAGIEANQPQAHAAWVIAAPAGPRGRPQRKAPLRRLVADRLPLPFSSTAAAHGFGRSAAGPKGQPSAQRGRRRRLGAQCSRSSRASHRRTRHRAGIVGSSTQEAG